MTQLKLNHHILKLKESATLAINLKAIKLRKEGKSVYHWGFGQSPFPVPQAIQDELKERTPHKEYLPTAGLLTLRETLKNYYAQAYHVPFNVENILISPGSKELIFQLIYLLDGEFFIPAPSWVSYGPQVTLKGQKSTYIMTGIEQNYKLTPQILESSLSKKSDDQVILILNSPSNPTGQYYTDEEFSALTPILRRHNVIVIADEIYSQVNFDSDISPTLSKHYPERTIITGGLSKAHSAGGYRLGFMLIPDELEELVAPLKAMISETYSCVSGPIQYCAIKAWDGTESVIEHVSKCTRVHKVVGQYYYERFIAMGIKTPAPESAFYMFIDFSNFKDKLKELEITTCQQLADHLVEKYAVAILPGDDFYYPEESLTARIAFVDYDGAKILNQFSTIEEINIDDILMSNPQIKAGLDQLELFLKSLN